MPTNPLRLQVQDRIAVVLLSIVAGNDYFYTPHKVLRRFILPIEATGFPTYSVHPDSGGTIDLSGAPDLYDEVFYVSVKGYVQDTLNPGAKLEKSIRDVRKAINEDSKSGTVGSLGNLCVQVTFEKSPETDDGYLSLEGFGYFDQQVRVQIAGDFGEL